MPNGGVHDGERARKNAVEGCEPTEFENPGLSEDLVADRMELGNLAGPSNGRNWL
jgi:hypothetical protein